MTKTLLDTAQRTLARFDFERVQSCMQKVGWRYGCDKDAPAIERLRETAEYHFLRVLTNPLILWSSGGGFVATRQGDTVILLFALETWEIDAPDNDALD